MVLRTRETEKMKSHFVNSRSLLILLLISEERERESVRVRLVSAIGFRLMAQPLTGVLGAEVDEAIPGTKLTWDLSRLNSPEQTLTLPERPHVTLVFEVNREVHEVKPGAMHQHGDTVSVTLLGLVLTGELHTELLDKHFPRIPDITNIAPGGRRN